MLNEIKDSSFESDLKKSEIALVDFWAPWCGPCKMLMPTIEEISEEMKDVSFFKYNIDEDMDFSRKFGVKSVPTLILFKNGEAVDMRVGGAPKADLINWIKDNK